MKITKEIKEALIMKVKLISISEKHKFCKDCIYNESADDKDYNAKLICGRHGKIVDIRDEACEAFEKQR